MVSRFVEDGARRAALTELALACGDSAELERLAEAAAEIFQVACAAISVSDGPHQEIIAGFGLQGLQRSGALRLVN
jgi:hypothetical protein